MDSEASYKQLKKKLLKLTKENSHLKKLYQAATAIESNFSSDAVIESIAIQIATVLNATGCTIELWRPDKNLIEVLIDYSQNHPDEVEKPGKTYDLATFPATLHVLQNRQIKQLQVDDPAADAAEVALMQEMEVYSLLLVPIMTQNRVLGLIEVYEEEEARYYSSDELHLAQSLACQGAITLENFQLYKNARDEIEKRKKIELELQESKGLFDSFMGHLPALAFMKDIQGRYIYVNRAYRALYDLDPNERIGKTDAELFPIDVANQIQENDQYVLSEGKVIKNVEPVEFNGQTYHHLTSKFPIFKDGKVVILGGIAFDISDRVEAEKERKRLEKKLLRSQRMETLGLLAGGVAHDLNNVLSGIVSYPELLLLDLPEDSPLRKSIITIQNSGKKAAEIVDDLLVLTRRGVMHNEIINLNDIVSEYLNSPELKRLISFHSNVVIDANLEPDLLNVEGSAIHLKKSVMNLVSNAAESQSRGGKIVISTQNRYVDRPVSQSDDFKEGDYVVLNIEDNGEGIAKDDLQRIFEPFYTKKVMGRSGTGLGMSVVWGTVQDHNGHINVESAEGQGTRFELFFPVVRKNIAKKKQHKPIDTYMGDQETILVVDDVADQREIATRILQRLEYKVTAVSSGEAAIAHLKEHVVDLVILDMIMDPGLDGLDTYKQIIKIHPNQKAIIASGFAETERVHKVKALGAKQYIKKPYTLEKIGLAVKRELE